MISQGAAAATEEAAEEAAEDDVAAAEGLALMSGGTGCMYLSMGFLSHLSHTDLLTRSKWRRYVHAQPREKINASLVRLTVDDVSLGATNVRPTHSQLVLLLNQKSNVVLQDHMC